MTEEFISLALIALAAFLCPLIAKALLRGRIPETVLLLIAGALLGPYGMGCIELSDSILLLKDLGLGFLFLLAGYEIDPKNLTSAQGKRGLLTWIISMLLAAVAVFLSPVPLRSLEGIAIAIALTTTALGALIPILKERSLIGTQIGQGVLSYGTWGELCPIIAMALLLSTRAKWETILILIAFSVVAVLFAVIPRRGKERDSHLFQFLSEHANSTSQTQVRAVVLLMIVLVAISAVFDLDIVLGAFASGFIMRYVIPNGNDTLEMKLDGIAYGFLVPLFFIASGAAIDASAIAERPELLVGFIVILLLVRAAPIFISLTIHKDTADTITRRNRVTIALYSTMALPLIVAVTSVAVSAGAMTQQVASIIVAAGAITVFLMPLLASLSYHVVKEYEAHYGAAS